MTDRNMIDNKELIHMYQPFLKRQGSSDVLKML